MASIVLTSCTRRNPKGYQNNAAMDLTITVKTTGNVNVNATGA